MMAAHTDALDLRLRGRDQADLIDAFVIDDVMRGLSVLATKPVPVYARAANDALRDQLFSGPLPQELDLEAGLYNQVKPILSRLYQAPLSDSNFRNAYESGRGIRGYIRAAVVGSVSAGGLKSVLRRGLTGSTNLGGQMGLALLGLPGSFNVTDRTILGKIDQQVEDLTSVGGGLSLIDTTIDEVSNRLEDDRRNGLTLLDAVPVFNAWVLGRTIIRTASIVQTESVRASRLAMLYAFMGNGISGVRFYTQGDERVCQQCYPIHGELFDLSRASVFDPMDGVPSYARVPLHPRCRCFYDPVTDGWLKPAIIWTGFLLDNLYD